MSYSLKTEIEKTKNLFLLCVVCISDVVKGFFFSTLSPKITVLTLEESCGPILRAKTFTYCSSRNPFPLCSVAPGFFRFLFLFYKAKKKLGNGTFLKFF